MRNIVKNKKKDLYVKVLLYLILFLISIITLFPFFWAFVSSFRSDIEIFKYVNPLNKNTFIPVDFTTQAYVNLFTLRGFQRPILNTLIVVVFSIMFGCMINGIAGFAFAKFKFKFKSILFGIVMVSFMVPFEAISIPLYSLVNKLGWIDTFQGLLVPTIADGLVLFLFKQFFEEIPDSLIESARIDGANTLTIFFRVVIPLSVPIMITAGLMVFISNWGAFMWPLIAAHSPSHKLIQVALADFQQEHGTLWSEMFAASVITSVIPVILFLPFQKYYVEGVTSSGIKG